MSDESLNQSAANTEDDESRYDLTREQLSGAQGNLMLCVGIVIGMDAILEGRADSKRNFIENAIVEVVSVDDDSIREILKNIQDYLTEAFARANS